MPGVDKSAGSNLGDYERARRAADRARAALSAYPNVVAIGVGTKQVAGEHTETWCVSVLVRAKCAANALPAGGVVPPEVDGVPTDVFESGEFAPLIIDPKDKLDCYDFVTYRPLRGGIKIGTQLPPSTTGIEEDNGAIGTLGCVVITKDAPPRHVGLTNRHVIEKGLPPPHGIVGQAHPDPGSSCCGSSEIIGNVLRSAPNVFGRGDVYQVDAALIALNDGLKWIAGIATAGRGTSSPATPIGAIRDLRPGAPQNLQVKKRGARTGPTIGHVVNVNASQAITLDGNTFNGIQVPRTTDPYYLSLPVITVKAHSSSPKINITAATRARPCQVTAPGHSFVNGEIVFVTGVAGMDDLNGKGYRVSDASPGAGTFTLRDLEGHPVDSVLYSGYTSGGTVELFVPFGLPGDSGSLVCDMNDNVIGLLFGGNLQSPATPAGARALVCHIEDVLSVMNITLPRTSTTPGEQVVPANNNPNKTATTAPMTNVMAKLQNDLLDTQRGVAVARAILAHEREVQTLIRTNKRVAARWRHVTEQSLVHDFVEAVKDPDRRLSDTPAVATFALNRFADILTMYASVRLRDDVAALRDVLVPMVDLTYRDAIASLGSRAGDGFDDMGQSRAFTASPLPPLGPDDDAANSMPNVER